ncbi:hypothetical protein ACROYT_G032635 [Oculina patagonica]
MMAEEDIPPDFSQPWELSDVVLLVEGKKFHVHKSVLCLWSSVFSRMFQSDFKEKGQDCIPLPGKTAKQFRQVLQAIYPSVEKPIKTLKNCKVLLSYGREYLMSTLLKRCEAFLSEKLNSYGKEVRFSWRRRSSDMIGQEKYVSRVMKILILAQEYEFLQLETKCVNKLMAIQFSELKVHPQYENIKSANRLLILEGRVSELEKEQKEQKERNERDNSSSSNCRSVAYNCYMEFGKIVNLLGRHISQENFKGCIVPEDYDTYPYHLECIGRDAEAGSAEENSRKRRRCDSMAELYEPLNKLDSLLQDML